MKETSHKGKYLEITIKIDENFSSFSIKQIFEYKGILKETLKLPDHVHLQVTSVKEGCVELTFQLIGLPEDTPFQLSLNQKKSLACNKIILLEYAGKVEFNHGHHEDKVYLKLLINFSCSIICMFGLITGTKRTGQTDCICSRFTCGECSWLVHYFIHCLYMMYS